MDVKKVLVVLGSILAALLIGGGIWFRFSLTGFFEPRCINPNIQVESMDAFDACVSEVVEHHGLVGMSVAVVTADGGSWSNGYGYANIEEDRLVTPDTPFLLSSITKTFVGVAVMQQVEAGNLDLDEDINTYLPFTIDNPRVEGEVITLRDLATHTSGLIDNYDVYGSSYVPGDSPVPLAEFIEGYYVLGGEYYYAEGNFSECTPGECYNYSNIGTALAAYTVEIVSGEPFNEYVEAHILAPLGMENSHFFLSDYDDHSIIAMPYITDAEDNPEAYGYYGYPSYPDGHLYTSANDMGAYLAAVMNEGELNGARILQPEMVELMLTPQNTTWDISLDERIYYGAFEQEIFWFTSRGNHGHDGGDFGSFTLMFFEPENEVGIVILTNHDFLDQNASIVSMQMVKQVMRNSAHMAELLNQ